MDSLLNKLEASVQKMEKDEEKLRTGNMSKLEFEKYLQDEVVESLAHNALRQIRLPEAGSSESSEFVEEPSIYSFVGEEIKEYITRKENKNGNKNIFETKRIHNSIGHVCVRMKKDLEDFMDYDVGSYCKDDWNLAQKLMLHECDPYPEGVA